MKKILILSMAAFLILGFTSQATAALAQFYTIDDSNDYRADINIFDNTGQLWYKVGGGASWTNYTSPSIPVTTSLGGRSLVELAIGPNVNNLTKLAFSMQFMGENLPNLPNHYDSLIVNWTENLFSKVEFIGNANGADNLSPVPLPGAALLLGSGLIGLVGVRRRFMS